MRVVPLALVVAGAAGCGQLPVGPQICDRPETAEPRDYRQGFCRGDTFMTADWDTELLHYPKGAFYRIFHGFTERPAEIDCYLSFKRHGNASEGEDDRPASIAPGAGNECQIQRVTEEYIEVVNGTCSEFWLLLTARAGGSACAMPEDGADPQAHLDDSGF
jgi:hypothetical protein